MFSYQSLTPTLQGDSLRNLEFMVNRKDNLKKEDCEIIVSDRINHRETHFLWSLQSNLHTVQTHHMISIINHINSSFFLDIEDNNIHVKNRKLQR